MIIRLDNQIITELFLIWLIINDYSHGNLETTFLFLILILLIRNLYKYQSIQNTFSTPP